MSARMNEIEAALLRLQPAPVNQGPMLIEMGRATATRSARTWRWVSALTTTVAAALALVIAMRPDAATRIQFVRVPVSAPADVVRESSPEPNQPRELPLSAWRWRQHQVHIDLEPISDEDDGDSVAPRPLRAGDAVQNTSEWRVFTNSGVR